MYSSAVKLLINYLAEITDERKYELNDRVARGEGECHRALLTRSLAERWGSYCRGEVYSGIVNRNTDIFLLSMIRGSYKMLCHVI